MSQCIQSMPWSHNDLNGYSRCIIPSMPRSVLCKKYSNWQLTCDLPRSVLCKKYSNWQLTCDLHSMTYDVDFLLGHDLLLDLWLGLNDLDWMTCDLDWMTCYLTCDLDQLTCDLDWMTCDLDWMTCDLDWMTCDLDMMTCVLNCDLTWTCKKWSVTCISVAPIIQESWSWCFRPFSHHVVC